MSDEHAKAVQKVADLASKVAEGVAWTFGDVSKELAKWAGEAVVSKRDLWRLQNHLQTRERVQEILAEKGISAEDARRIPNRIMLPLVEAIECEDDPGIGQMWANLTANAVNPTLSFNITKAYIDILRSIDPLEALILRETLRIGGVDERGNGITTEIDQFASRVQASAEDIEHCLGHLTSLGCYEVQHNEVVWGVGNHEPDPRPVIASKHSVYIVTLLGLSLLAACGATED